MTLRSDTDAALAAERASYDVELATLRAENDSQNSLIASYEAEILDLSGKLADANSLVATLRLQLAECEGATTPKPVPKGVFSRKGVNPRGISTVPVYWNAEDFAALDAMIAEAPDVVRVRPFLGVHAPQWAKTLGNGPITYTEPQGGDTVEIPDIWSAEYQAAAAEWLADLAAHIDNDDRIGTVFASGAMTYYAEPLIRGTQSKENRAAFLAAGYTMEADAEAQFWQLDAMQAFRRTNVGLAYNPWQYITANGYGGQSVQLMGEVMDYHLAQFGDRAILQNNSIRSSYITSPPVFYDEFTSRNATKQFQCAAAVRVGDEAATIRWAIDVLGASGIEHSGTLTNAQYAAFDAELKEV